LRTSGAGGVLSILPPRSPRVAPAVIPAIAPLSAAAERCSRPL